MDFPEGFRNAMCSLLGDSADAFFDAMRGSVPVSVRLNTRKPGAVFPVSETVAWCPVGLYLPERPVFTLDPLLHAGAYYVQEASSMIMWQVGKTVLGVLGNETGEGEDVALSVADFCAAPGGKTTALADALPDGCRIVANEFVAKRCAVLAENVAKWGGCGITVTNRDVGAFAREGAQFDVVLVDAPCSGEGMMRRDKAAREQWSPELVAGCAALQREILTQAAATVRPGGFLVYSTCTFNRDENEVNAEYVRDSLGFEPFNPSFPEEWGIGKGIGTDLPVARFMPHLTKGEGLFLAMFRKPGCFEKQTVAYAKDIMIGGAGRLKSPVKTSVGCGRVHRCREKDYGKGVEESVPAIEEVLSVGFDKSRWPSVELDLEKSLAYLRRESVVLGPDVPRGYVVMCYRGLPLGMAKNIGSRANNLYPKNWRILMR